MAPNPRSDAVTDRYVLDVVPIGTYVKATEGTKPVSRKKISSPQEERSDAPRAPTGDRLRAIASDLFYREGIRAVGVDQIVTETGVTKPTFYRNYESKDELISACLLECIEMKRSQLDAIAGRFPDDPLAQIRAIVRLFADDIGAPDYRGCAVNNAAVEFPNQSHPVREIVENSKAESRGRLRALATQLQVKNPDLLADGLMLLIEGASTCRHTSGSQGPASALVEATDALLSAFLGSAPERDDARTLKQ